MIKPCRECSDAVSPEAMFCPKCGCPSPAKSKEDLKRGIGFEYKSKVVILGLPLVHVSFKFGANRLPVPAKGIISIGQFGMGIINISQFGIGIFCLSQFAIAGWAITQFGIAYSLIAQFGIYIDHGMGLGVISVGDALGRLF